MSSEGEITDTSTDMEALTHKEIADLENTLLEGSCPTENTTINQGPSNYNMDSEHQEDQPIPIPEVTTPERTIEGGATDQGQNTETKTKEKEDEKEKEKKGMKLREKKGRNYMEQHTGKPSSKKCEECENLRKKIHKLEDKIKNATNQTPKAKKMQEEIARMKDQAKQMLNERISQELLQNEIAELKEEIQKLNESKKALELENECLIICNDALQEEVEESNAKDELEKIKSENKKLKQTTVMLKTKETKNQEEINNSKAEIDQLKTIINKLNVDLAEKTKAQAQTKKENVLILGDSNAKKYVTKIKQDEEAKIDIAVTYTTKDLLKYVKENRKKIHGSSIIISTGTNDIRNQVPTDQILRNT